MAITHTFVDFIPSVFLGCPDTDTELSIGHKIPIIGFLILFGIIKLPPKLIIIIFFLILTIIN